MMAEGGVATDMIGVALCCRMDAQKLLLLTKVIHDLWPYLWPRVVLEEEQR